MLQGVECNLIQEVSSGPGDLTDLVSSILSLPSHWFAQDDEPSETSKKLMVGSEQKDIALMKALRGRLEAEPDCFGFLCKPSVKYKGLSINCEVPFSRLMREGYPMLEEVNVKNFWSVCLLDDQLRVEFHWRWRSHETRSCALEGCDGLKPEWGLGQLQSSLWIIFIHTLQEQEPPCFWRLRKEYSMYNMAWYIQYTLWSKAWKEDTDVEISWGLAWSLGLTKIKVMKPTIKCPVARVGYYARVRHKKRISAGSCSEMLFYWNLYLKQHGDKEFGEGSVRRVWSSSKHILRVYPRIEKTLRVA